MSILKEIADASLLIAQNQQKVFDSGKAEGVKSEYDRFWDSFQNNGNADYYPYAFGGPGWAADGLLPPKYPITLRKAISSSQGMFVKFDRPASIDYNKPLYDLSAVCAKIDFSKVTQARETFRDARARNINIDLSGCNTLYYTFASGDGGQLNNITLKVSDTLTTIQYAFYYQSAMTHLTFAEGSVIACNGLDLQWSTSLNNTSITSIINALSTTTTGKSITLSKTAVNKAFGINVDDTTTYPEGSEYYNLRHSKDNWTINYV